MIIATDDFPPEQPLYLTMTRSHLSAPRPSRDEQGRRLPAFEAIDMESNTQSKPLPPLERQTTSPPPGRALAAYPPRPTQGLPGWPALMDTAMACAYVSLGETDFQRFVAHGGVEPLELGIAEPRWRRSDLDALAGAISRTPDALEAPVSQPSQVERLEGALRSARRRRAGAR